jgi:hypothetical protein
MGNMEIRKDIKYNENNYAILLFRKIDFVINAVLRFEFSNQYLLRMYCIIIIFIVLDILSYFHIAHLTSIRGHDRILVRFTSTHPISA